jgi:hypothetical protein
MKELKEPLSFDKNRWRVKHCPCGKSNKDGKFSPFKGCDNLGKCFSCNRMFLPENDGEEIIDKARYAKPAAPMSLMTFDTVLASCARYSENNFANWMTEVCGKPLAQEVFEMYYLGTSNKWDGAAVFWQIDWKGNVRGGKIMAFDKDGKRIKEPRSLITRVHSEMGLVDYKLKECFFGEHLLTINPSKQVCIVESEKTAMLCAVYMPQFVWIATGGKNGCNFNLKQYNHVLTGRDVTLYPDVGEEELWRERSSEIPGATVRISEYLSAIAQKEGNMKGQDLADYLPIHPVSTFSKRANTRVESAAGAAFVKTNFYPTKAT